VDDEDDIDATTQKCSLNDRVNHRANRIRPQNQTIALSILSVLFAYPTHNPDPNDAPNIAPKQELQKACIAASQLLIFSQLPE
jgi:hypothetical protein